MRQNTYSTPNVTDNPLTTTNEDVINSNISIGV